MASLEVEVVDKKSRDILDLSQVEVRSELELKKLIEKIPDFKLRSEKVRNDDLVIDDEMTVSLLNEDNAKSGVTSTTCDYQFLNPIPMSMKDVCLKELGRVNISWRMLTLARPKVKIDEDFFSRLVQLEKLQYKTINWEREKELIKEKKGLSSSLSSQLRVRGSAGCAGGRGPSRGSANFKSAVAEIRLQTCKECGVEFCFGNCKKFHYDDCARTFNPITEDIFNITRKVVLKSKKLEGQSGSKCNFKKEGDEDNDKKPGSSLSQYDGCENIVENKTKITSEMDPKSIRSDTIQETRKVKLKSKVKSKVKQRKSKKNS